MAAAQSRNLWYLQSRRRTQSTKDLVLGTAVQGGFPLTRGNTVTMQTAADNTKDM
jgi:hypothetical protein